VEKSFPLRRKRIRNEGGEEAGCVGCGDNRVVRGGRILRGRGNHGRGRREGGRFIGSGGKKKEGVVQ